MYLGTLILVTSIDSAVAGDFGLNLNALDNSFSAGMVVYVIDHFKR